MKMTKAAEKVWAERGAALKKLVKKLEKAAAPHSGLKEPTNKDRAEWARNAVEAFAVTVGDYDEDLETQMKDLVADMMHLCDHEGLDWGRILTSADDYHRDEQLEEEGNAS